MKQISARCWALVAVLFGSALSAQPVAYFETLDLDSQWASAELTKSGGHVLDLSAFASPMRVTVESNSGLLDRSPREVAEAIAASNTLLLKGEVTGSKASWVRLARVGGQWSGALWDGHELYLIDDAAALRASGFQGVPWDAKTVIFRQTEVRWPAARDLVVAPYTEAVLPPGELKLSNFGFPVHRAQKGSASGSSRVLSMTIVADTEFVAINSSDPAGAVMARINVVDGVYASQTGVALRVAHLELLEDNGPLTQTDSGDLLVEFRDYMRDSDLPQPGLTHLFSGKNFDSNIVGVAYLGVLCSQNWGFGINEFRGSGSSGAMILAHEMGHNFGAPHDGSGACASETFRGIMNPSINGSDQFSQCSLDTMADDISRASCLEIIDFVWANGFE